MRLLFQLLTIVTFCSCVRNESQIELIEGKTFERIYIELLDSAQVIQSMSDSVLSPVAKRILARHNVTVHEFTATVKEYHSDARRWKEFYENVSSSLDERLKAKDDKQENP